jgi:hypothetical protein
MMTLDPIGVSLDQVRASLEFEAAAGRGPDSASRLQQAEDERRELARLMEHHRDHPESRPHDWSYAPPAGTVRPVVPPVVARKAPRFAETPLFDSTLELEAAAR